MVKLSKKSSKGKKQNRVKTVSKKKKMRNKKGSKLLKEKKQKSKKRSHKKVKKIYKTQKGGDDSEVIYEEFTSFYKEIVNSEEEKSMILQRMQYLSIFANILITKKYTTKIIEKEEEIKASILANIGKTLNKKQEFADAYNSIVSSPGGGGVAISSHNLPTYDQHLQQQKCQPVYISSHGSYKENLIILPKNVIICFFTPVNRFVAANADADKNVTDENIIKKMIFENQKEIFTEGLSCFKKNNIYNECFQYMQVFYNLCPNITLNDDDSMQYMGIYMNNTGNKISYSRFYDLEDLINKQFTDPEKKYVIFIKACRNIDFTIAQNIDYDYNFLNSIYIYEKITSILNFIIDKCKLNMKIKIDISNQCKMQFNKFNETGISSLHGIEYNPQVKEDLLRELTFKDHLLSPRNNNLLYYFKNASHEIRNNKKIVKQIIRLNVDTLKYASDALKKDREFILEAIEINVDALKYASDELKADKEIVLAAVKQNGVALKHASEALKEDKEIVLTAVEQNCVDALKYASDALKGDMEFMLSAIYRNGVDALKFASYELKEDREFMLSAINIDGLALTYASYKLIEVREFMLSAIKIDGLALTYTSYELKADKEIVLAAVKQNGVALKHASEALKEDKEIVLAAVEQNGVALEHASEALKEDKEIVLAAVKQNGVALEHASEALKGNNDFMLSAININVEALEHASEALKGNNDFMLSAIEKNYLALEHVSEALKGDMEFMLSAIEKNYLALEYASYELKGNNDFMLSAININVEALEHASSDLKGNNDFMLSAININVEAIKYINTYKLWNCKCNAINLITETKCKRCNAIKPEPWICPDCGVKNEYTDINCQLCGATKKPQ